MGFHAHTCGEDSQAVTRLFAVCRHQNEVSAQPTEMDPTDRDPFPAASQAAAEADSPSTADSSLAESDRPADLSDAWWKRLNEVTCVVSVVLLPAYDA